MELKDWLIPILSSVIGGAMALLGAIWAVRESTKDLEVIEIRRQRVTCVCNLSGLRYAITAAILTPDDRSRVLFELNRIQILWSDDADVLNLSRQFFATRDNLILINLLRAMGRNTRLPVHNLRDIDYTNVFLMS